MATELSSDFWVRLRQVAASIGARPEDLIIVLASETAGTMNPHSTDWARFAGAAPTSWAEVKQRCSDYYKLHHGGGDNKGFFCGGLGLNTIMAEVAQAMGMSPQEWWSLPDMTPTQALDTTERYFKYLLSTYGQGKTGFVNALDLYLANAALGAWRTRPLTMATVVYGPNSGYSGNVVLDNIGVSDAHGLVVTPGRSGKKGFVDVEDMKNAVLNSYNSVAQPYLNQYNRFLTVASLDPTPSSYHPINAVTGYSPWDYAYAGYTPEEAQGNGQAALDAINSDGLRRPTVNPNAFPDRDAPLVDVSSKLVAIGLMGVGIVLLVHTLSK